MVLGEGVAMLRRLVSPEIRTAGSGHRVHGHGSNGTDAYRPLLLQARLGFHISYPYGVPKAPSGVFALL
jgi:hypothetical protein